jgi:L-alanine-DL-glutamate epimerase-like enolase superfamily enzyme
MLRFLHAVPDRFGLRSPFRISRGVKTVADVVTVTIRQGDLVGRGEGVPYARYGETVEGTLAAIDAVRPVIEAGEGRDALARAMPPGAARNAVDCALWDLEARLAGTSVAALAGRLAPAPLASALTIGIDSADAMAAVARAAARAPLLKVKVDADGAADRLRAVRAAAPAPRLIVDPNESWTIDDLVRLEDLLVECGVDLLEQPLPAGKDDALAGRRWRVPVCADESLHTSGDLDGLAGRYTHLNIKLDKTGGLTEALALAEAARSRGFGLMVGCMVCSSLGIAPAMLVADGAEFVDLDGPLWLAQDRPGGVVDQNGVLSPPAPGFWGGAG